MEIDTLTMQTQLLSISKLEGASLTNLNHRSGASGVKSGRPPPPSNTPRVLQVPNFSKFTWTTVLKCGQTCRTLYKMALLCGQWWTPKGVVVSEEVSLSGTSKYCTFRETKWKAVLTTDSFLQISCPQFSESTEWETEEVAWSLAILIIQAAFQQSKRAPETIQWTDD